MNQENGMNDVLEFWFETLEPKQWYRKSDELDARITERFEATYHAVVTGEKASWRDTPEGRLAEIIVLDQFARNMFRGTPQSFSADPLALALAQEGIRNGADKALVDGRREFMYMPFMHSESRLIHEQAMLLFADSPNLDFEIRHKAQIDRFGRYPHRNAVLGRASTPEEIDWLKENSGF